MFILMVISIIGLVVGAIVILRLRSVGGGLVVGAIPGFPDRVGSSRTGTRHSAGLLQAKALDRVRFPVVIGPQ